MAKTQAEIQASIDAIETEIANPVESTSFGDRSVRKRSMEELLNARALLLAEKGRTATPARPRQYRLWAKKGL